MACTIEPVCSAKLAVLIDADNAQASNIEALLAEVAKHGTASVKRAYGDWTGNRLQSWKDPLLKHSIQPIQQFAYTKGKNATDSALIIDAMDLLYTNRLGGFCIVSSDSDFTRLASRIRESGLMVIGLGRQVTPTPFVAACDKFIYVETLVSEMPQFQDPRSNQDDGVNEESATDESMSATESDDDSDTPISNYSDPGDSTDDGSPDNKPPSTPTRMPAVPEPVMKIRAALRAMGIKRGSWVTTSRVGAYLCKHYPDFTSLHGRLGPLLNKPEVRRFIVARRFKPNAGERRTNRYLRER